MGSFRVRKSDLRRKCDIMIFVTTGTQEPFNRLIKVIEEVAPMIDDEIIVQAFGAESKISNVKICSFLTPEEFNNLFVRARLIVSHAGMGTVITALTNNKPLLIMPRMASLGEHRNEHQLATAVKLKELGYVYVADNECELKNTLIRLLAQDTIPVLHHIGNFASQKLIDSVSDSINRK